MVESDIDGAAESLFQCNGHTSAACEQVDDQAFFNEEVDLLAGCWRACRRTAYRGVEHVFSFSSLSPGFRGGWAPFVCAAGQGAGWIFFAWFDDLGCGS